MKPAVWDEDAYTALRPSVAANPYGPLAQAHEVFRDAMLYRYIWRGQDALVAVRPVQFDAGVRMDVVGLRSLGDRLDVGEFNAAQDDLARSFGARLLCMSTQVPHVSRQCVRTGWAITGAIHLRVID